MASKVELNRKLEALEKNHAKLYIALRAAKAAHETTLRKLAAAQKKLAKRCWPWYRRMWAKVRALIRRREKR